MEIQLNPFSGFSGIGSDIKDNIRQHKEFYTTAGLVAGIAISLTALIHSIGETVYSGKLNGYNIKYEEGRVGFDTPKNQMTAEKDGVTYTFKDFYERTNIEWRSQTRPDFENDSLEEVVVKTPEGEKSFFNYNNIYDETTIEGQATKEVFENANVLYNNLRQGIRDKLRRDLNSEYDNVLNTFNAEDESSEADVSDASAEKN